MLALLLLAMAPPAWASAHLDCEIRNLGTDTQLTHLSEELSAPLPSRLEYRLEGPEGLSGRIVLIPTPGAPEALNFLFQMVFQGAESDYDAAARAVSFADTRAEALRLGDANVWLPSSGELVEATCQVQR